MFSCDTMDVLSREKCHLHSSKKAICPNVPLCPILERENLMTASSAVICHLKAPNILTSFSFSIVPYTSFFPRFSHSDLIFAQPSLFNIGFYLLHYGSSISLPLPTFIRYICRSMQVESKVCKFRTNILYFKGKHLLVTWILSNFAGK
jgi:hypothetical protein